MAFVTTFVTWEKAVLCNWLSGCWFLCYLEKVCLRKHEKFLFNSFTELCNGSGGKIQVIKPAPYTEQNHCLGWGGAPKNLIMGIVYTLARSILIQLFN